MYPKTPYLSCYFFIKLDFLAYNSFSTYEFCCRLDGIKTDFIVAIVLIGHNPNECMVSGFSLLAAS